MKTRITVIVDNIDYNGLSGEWGLSLLIEYGEHKILLDAGASGLFAENLKSLGFNMEEIEAAVLSHAHYDHANGMKKFFEGNQTAKFYIREAAAENCYAKKWIFRKYIGMPRHILRDYSDRIERVTGDFKLCDGVWLIPHKTLGLEAVGRRELMFQKQGHRFVPDDFSHEQSLVLETDRGLLILNSCSHGGAANIIREVSETFPDKPIYGLIGGLHLFNKSEAEVREVARAIRETGIQYVCTGHCTKNRAYGIMKSELGDKLEQLHVGLIMEF